LESGLARQTEQLKETSVTELAALKARNVRLESRLARQTVQLEDRDASLAAKDTLISAKDQEIGRLGAHIIARDAAGAQMSHQIHVLEQDLSSESHQKGLLEKANEFQRRLLDDFRDKHDDATQAILLQNDEIEQLRDEAIERTADFEERNLALREEVTEHAEALLSEIRKTKKLLIQNLQLDENISGLERTDREQKAHIQGMLKQLKALRTNANVAATQSVAVVGRADSKKKRKLDNPGEVENERASISQADSGSSSRSGTERRQSKRLGVRKADGDK